MIAHISIPARQPRIVAQALATLIEGVVLPFPVVDGADIVIARDGSGFAIEVVPETSVHHPGSGAAGQAPGGLQVMPWEVQIRPDGPVPGPGPYHVALYSALDVAAIEALAHAHGWRALECDRGGAFKVVEFWIENRVLIEVLTEAEGARYRAFAQPEQAAAMFGTIDQAAVAVGSVKIA